MADDCQPRPRRHRREDRLEELGVAFDLEGQPRDDDACVGQASDLGLGVEDRVVLVVRRQELVARLEPERAEDGRHAGRRVRNEDEALGIRVQERRHLASRRVEALLEGRPQEPDRLGLELVDHRPLGLEDRHRTGSERAVVQVRDPGIEAPGGVGAVRLHGPGIDVRA